MEIGDFSALAAQIKLGELVVDHEAQENLKALEAHLDQKCGRTSGGSSRVPAGNLVTYLENYLQDLKTKRKRGHFFVVETRKAHNTDDDDIYDLYYYQMENNIRFGIMDLDLFISKVEAAIRLYRMFCLS